MPKPQIIRFPQTPPKSEEAKPKKATKKATKSKADD